MNPGVFLIDGPSGSGKTTVLNIAHATIPSVVVRKLTTKATPPAIDLISVSDGRFEGEVTSDAQFIAYTLGGRRYGYSFGEVVNAARSGCQVLVIVRDLAAIRQSLALAKAARIPATTVLLQATEEKCLNNLCSAGWTPEEAMDRMARDEGRYGPEYDELFDHVIDANCGRDELVDRFMGLLRHDA